MIDIVLLTCTIIGGTLLGIYAARQKKRYCKFLQDSLNYVNEFAINVRGRKLLLAEFSQKFSTTCGKEFSDYVLSENKECKYKTLKPVMDEFWQGLQTSSTDELNSHLESCAAKLKAMTDQALPECSKLCVTYVKLGFLAGVMLGIVVM